MALIDLNSENIHLFKLYDNLTNETYNELSEFIIKYPTFHFNSNCNRLPILIIDDYICSNTCIIILYYFKLFFCKELDNLYNTLYDIKLKVCFLKTECKIREDINIATSPGIMLKNDLDKLDKIERNINDIDKFIKIVLIYTDYRNPSNINNKISIFHDIRYVSEINNKLIELVNNYNKLIEKLDTIKFINNELYDLFVKYNFRNISFNKIIKEYEYFEYEITEKQLKVLEILCDKLYSILNINFKYKNQYIENVLDYLYILNKIDS